MAVCNTISKEYLQSKSLSEFQVIYLTIFSTKSLSLDVGELTLNVGESTSFIGKVTGYHVDKLYPAFICTLLQECRDNGNHSGITAS